MGCAKHVKERLDDAMFRHEFGKTTSPEEDFAKRFKKWFNACDDKNLEDVSGEGQFLLAVL